MRRIRMLSLARIAVLLVLASLAMSLPATTRAASPSDWDRSGPCLLRASVCYGGSEPVPGGTSNVGAGAWLPGPVYCCVANNMLPGAELPVAVANAQQTLRDRIESTLGGSAVQMRALVRYNAARVQPDLQRLHDDAERIDAPPAFYISPMRHLASGAYSEVLVLRTPGRIGDLASSVTYFPTNRHTDVLWFDVHGRHGLRISSTGAVTGWAPRGLSASGPCLQEYGICLGGTLPPLRVGGLPASPWMPSSQSSYSEEVGGLLFDMVRTSVVAKAERGSAPFALAIGAFASTPEPSGETLNSAIQALPVVPGFYITPWVHSPNTDKRFMTEYIVIKAMNDEFGSNVERIEFDVLKRSTTVTSLERQGRYQVRLRQ